MPLRTAVPEIVREGGAMASNVWGGVLIWLGAMSTCGPVGYVQTLVLGIVYRPDEPSVGPMSWWISMIW